jgi:hypothetical protein
LTLTEFSRERCLSYPKDKGINTYIKKIQMVEKVTKNPCLIGKRSERAKESHGEQP